MLGVLVGDRVAEGEYGVFRGGEIDGDAILSSAGPSSLLVVGEGVFFAGGSTDGLPGVRPKKNPVIPPAIATNSQAAMIILRVFLLPSPPRGRWFLCILRFNSSFSAFSRFIRSSWAVTAFASRHSRSISGSVSAFVVPYLI